MKKRKLLLLSLLSMASIGAVGLTSCEKDKDQPNPDIAQIVELNITGTKQTMTVSEAKSLDLKSLFTIKYDNASIPVTEEMINKGEFKAEVGSYDITLTYNGSVATSTIKVIADASSEIETKALNITTTNTKVLVSEVENLDLKTLFKIVEDDKEVAVTDEMITSNGGLKAEAGTYEITLKYQEETVTSTVTVYEKEIEHTSLNLAANNIVVELGDLNNLNLTSLFTITENDQAVRVLNSMIDAGDLLVDGSYTEKTGSYNVVLTYGDKTATAVVKVVHNSEVTILVNPDNCVTTKNNEDFDPTSLFSLYIGSEPQKVETEMLDTSKLDLGRTGKYQVTCNYDRFGESYDATAEVLVLPAVDIQTPKGDVIEAAGVYNSNEIFKFEKNFVIVVDGQVIPFEEGNLESNIVFESNLAQTGEYKVTYKLEIGGIEYEKSITYKLYKHGVTFTYDEETYKLSELTADNFNPVDDFDIKVNGSSVSYSDLLFVESSKVAETEPVEGKTIVPYTLTGAIQFGTKGDYEVTISFNVDGKEYSHTKLFHLVSDVVIKEASSKPVSVFKGASSYDYKTMFSVTKYDPTASYNKDKTVEVTDEMIDASAVDLTTVGEYAVVCTYEDMTYTKMISVIDAPFVGDYQAINQVEATPLSITANGVVTSSINSSEGTIEMKEDGSYLVKFGSTSYVMTYDNDVLTLTLNNAYSVNKSNCYVFVKNPNDWTFEVMSAYTDGKTSLAAVGDSEFVITKLTNTVDSTKSRTILLKVTYDGYGYDDYTYEQIKYYSANYYVNPDCTGTLLEGTNEITLDNTTYVFTFTTQDSVTSFTVTKKASSTTPSTPTEEEVGKEKGTYTGPEGTLTLDGKGTATVADSTTILPNYSGISYKMVDGKCILSWKDSDYITTVYSLVLNDGKYAHDTEDDGFKRIYQSGNYDFVNCLGNGIAYAYGIFKSGAQYCHYTVSENQLILTYVDGEETKEITFEISNGENVITMVEYPEDLYTSKKSYDSSVILNHKVTVLHDVYRIPQYTTIKASDLFKVEFMQNGEVAEMSLNSIVDFSVVDTNELGYQIATLKYQDEKYTYQASAILYVYYEPYRNHEYTGEYFLEKSYNGDYYLRLNADGTAEYVTYNTKNGTWSIEEDNSIKIMFGSEIYTATYEEGVVLLKYKYNGNWVYTYGFKNGRTEKIYSKDNKKIYVVTSNKGITEYYYIDNETYYGEVNALFAAKELADGVIVELKNGNGDVLLEAKISGSSSFVYAGPEKGTYQGSATDLILDGFGNATVGSNTGTYETYKTFYKVTINDVVTYYTLDLENKTYVIEPDSVVLAGLTKEYAIDVELIPNTHLISAVDKENWFKFTTGHGGTHTLSSDTSAYSLYDKAWLYNEAGDEIASFTSTYSNFKITAELTGNTTYWLKVELSSTKSDPVDDYFLSIAAPVEGAEKGSYTGEKGTIELDGFGTVTIGGATGTYKIVGEYIQIVMSESDSYYIRLNVADYAVEDVSYIIDNSAEFTFVLDENTHEWKSNNAGENSSTATLKVTAIKACTVSFLYKVSTESGYDKCTVYVNGVAVDNMKDLSGVVDYQETATVLTLNAGDVVTFEYKKDSSTNKNDDTFYIKNLVVTKITE